MTTRKSTHTCSVCGATTADESPASEGWEVYPDRPTLCCRCRLLKTKFEERVGLLRWACRALDVPTPNGDGKGKPEDNDAVSTATKPAKPAKKPKKAKKEAKP